MAIELAVVAVVVTWVSIGLALCIVMGRRGYDAFAWFIMGTTFGPFGIAMAVDAWRHPHESGGKGRLLRRAVAASGTVDVLIGIDGSPESRHARTAVKDLLGGRVRRVTLATVIPFDAAPETERAAIAALEHVASDGRDAREGRQVVRGQPAAALADTAATGGYELIAIGTRGKGRTHEILGSVATALSHHTTLPVLMFSNALEDVGSER